MRFCVEAEEGCGDFVGAGCGFALVARHLPFARTGQTVRVDGKQAALKVPAGTAQAPQGKLKFFGLLKGMSEKKIVHALIGNHEGKAVEKFKAFLAEGPGSPNVHHAQSGFMNQLHGHTGRKVGGGRSGPARQQIPSSQA